MTKETPSEWVSLRDAAAILGVHPTTVRNWADRGDLPSRRTPGGHRRFRLSDLQQWSTTRQTQPSTEAQMIIQSALGQARLKIGEGQMAALSWYQNLEEDDRGQMRTLGRRLLEQLQDYLAKTPDSAGRDDAVYALGREYARMLITLSLTLTQALEGFLFFNRFLHEAVLQVIEISAMRTSSECTQLLRRVHDFSSALLLGLAEVYQSAE